ncbi:ABC transporter permease [Aureimonas flava]|uniref:ABC transporter permease n=1 Tax=Aureimonas flava TaxID=2320271 RepID=A0A3A1WW96_9HYPH|nr:ABC transporter permease [Aureimonas flava]RIY03292.1 ABC transporter permease [Aureimonas flava]
MAGLLLRRILGLGALLVVVSLLVFVAFDLLPGDPAAVMLGTSARPDTLAALRAELGLDRPVLLRWLAWLGGALTGDFGRSLTYGMPVSGLIAQRMAVTLPLAVMALALALALGLCAGFLAARRPGGLTDRLAVVFAQAGMAVPNFWIGLLLILVFATTLGWMPAGGFPGWAAGTGAALGSLVLPATALALPQAAVLCRVARGALLETAGEDFLRTARAKGLSHTAALLRHGAPNALPPILTVVGFQFAFLIAGAVLVENVFALPGLGQLAYQALAQRDLVTLQAVALLLAAGVVVVNAAVDLVQVWIDPRARSPS